MAGENLLLQTFVYLIAAVIAVPVAKRLGLGSVLGYLLAGVAVGPYALNLVGGVESTMRFAEYGVVMMLFLIGLGVRPSQLWSMRGQFLGLGSGQVLGTAVAFCLVCLPFGIPWPMGLAIGLVLSNSSAAIILQSMQEKGHAKTSGGQATFAVLLFQDVSVIGILAVMPLLAMRSPAPGVADSASTSGGAPALVPNLVADLAPVPHAIMVIGVVTLVVMLSGPVLRRVFRYLAQSQVRELLTVMALLVVIGISILMQMIGLSAALGAFLAGMVLAESEYRHQLEADVDPFKGLLLGLFFITIGASLNVPLILERPTVILGIVAGIIAIKFALVLVMVRMARIEWSQALLVAIYLAQGSEFGFVMLNFALDHRVLTPELAALLNASIAVSMALAPILFTINTQLIQPRFTRLGAQREPDAIAEQGNEVILAGFGRFGHVVGRLLRANGYGVTVLDNDADQVEVLRKYGLKSYYGDATREDLLRLAGAERARLLIVAIDNEEQTLQIVRMAQEKFPNLRVFARAQSRADADDLWKLGVEKVHRATFGSALDMSVDALRAMGMPAKQALRAARIFRERDEESVRELALMEDQSEEAYISRARQHIQNLDALLQADTASGDGRALPDEAWEPPWEKGEGKDVR